MDTDRLMEQFRESPALRELCDKLLRAAGYFVRTALEREQGGEAVVPRDGLWDFGIDPNHDFIAADAVTGLLCERPEVEQVEEDGGCRLTLDPEACRLHRILPGFIRRGQAEAAEGGWYLDGSRLLELTGVNLQNDNARGLFFSMLDARPEVRNWFYNADYSGMGVELGPVLAPEPEESPGMGPKL